MEVNGCEIGDEEIREDLERVVDKTLEEIKPMLVQRIMQLLWQWEEEALRHSIDD